MELPSQAFPDPSLPRGTWMYKVDVRPREPMTLEVNGGIGSGSFREIMLFIDHPDASRGQRDIADMFVWGDVDTNFHPRISSAYSVNNPLRFQQRLPLLLSPGAGTKTINVRLRFVSGRTVDDSITYELLDDVPHVSILWGPFREYIPEDVPLTVAWSCSHPVSQIYVGLADAYDTPRSSCALISTGTNVTGSGSWTAGQKIESTFTYATALAAFPGIANTGNCFVRIFAVTPLGETS